ncbi:MAG: succinate dehydrogenase/fumarate reductase cytochrome b subunit [Geobacter sp.]|nr:succinate dehydrogenase/fumarate reductase cytochrome b subunit [Geobacter sp.]
MQLLTSSIGRKIVMAITGQAMVLFAVIHLLGNSSIFGWLNGGINAYAEHLHSLPLPIIIGFRLALLAMVCIHIWFGIQLTMENRGGRPQQYAVKAAQKATFASENMIWTGCLIGLFLVYHLLHFTFQVISPETAALKNLVPLHDQMVPNVLGMVVAGFKNFFVSFIYAGGMVVLFLHLSHGIQSFFQTMGWSCDKSQPIIVKLGSLVALVLFAGYVIIPLTVFFGILKG